MQPERSKSRPTPWLGILFGLIFMAIWLWSPVLNWLEGVTGDNIAHVQPLPVTWKFPPPDQICLEPQGNTLAAVVQKRLLLYDRRQQRVTTTIEMDETIQEIRYSQDGKIFVMKTADSIKLWDTRKWTIIKSISRNEIDRLGELKSFMAISENEILAAYENGERIISVVNLVTDKKLGEWEAFEKLFTQVDGNANGEWITANQRLTEIQLHEKTGALEDTIALTSWSIPEISADKKYIAWYAFGELIIFDRNSRGKKSIADNDLYKSAIIFITPDSQTVGFAGNSGIKLFDVHTGKLKSIFETAGRNVRSIHLCDNGKYIAASYFNEPRIDLWEIL